MKKELFVATSYHHLLTAIAKKFANNSVMDLFISNRSTADEYWNIYLDKIRENNWFRNIYYFDELHIYPPSPIRPLKTYLYEFGGERKLIAQIRNFHLDEYDMIYLIDDKMFLGSTVIKTKRPYHLCEDTCLTYQHMKTLRSSKVMNAPYHIICPILRVLNYWHPVFGYGENCVAIETSSFEGLPDRLPKKKIQVVDRMALINSIPKKEKEKIVEMFLDSETLKFFREKENIVLLMTETLTRNFLERADYKLQISVLKQLTDMYPDRNIIVKPHPRDDTDYQSAFPGLIILRRSFPSEVFSFIEDFHVDEIVSVGSTSVNSCDFAEKKRMIMPSEFGIQFR